MRNVIVCSYRHRGSTRSRSKKSWSLFTEEISIGNWESVRESERKKKKRKRDIEFCYLMTDR